MATTALPTPKVRRRSVSQLMSYSNCGEEYRLSRRTDAPQRPAGWLYHGVAVHEAIEAWEKSDRTMTEEELNLLYLTTYRTLVNEKLETSPLGEWMTGGWKKAQDDLTDREHVGWYQIEDYIQEALKASDAWEVVAVEQSFDLFINDIQVIGYIDQIARNKATNEIYAVDYKSGSKMPAAPVQLAIYRLAVQELYPEEVVADTFYWVHLGRPASKSGKTRPKPTKWVPEDLSDWPVERVARWLHDMDQAELQDIYLPSPSDGCRVCSVQQWCRAMGHWPSIQQYAPEDWLKPATVTLTKEEAE